MWFKVDDTLAFHEKVVSVGNAAMGLWVRGGAWSSQMLTDGVIPSHIITALEGCDHAPALVEAGLWDEHPKGYIFHDWDDYQFTREEVESKRKAERDRKREQRRNATGQYVGVPNGVPVGLPKDSARSHTNPSRPVPSLPKDTPATPPRADVHDICSTLADLIASNGSKRPTITEAWKTQARLLIDTDGRTVDDIKSLMRWAQQDTFWKSTVLSMPKFREKYDTLRLQSERDKPAAPTRNPNIPEGW